MRYEGLCGGGGLSAKAYLMRQDKRHNNIWGTGILMGLIFPSHLCYKVQVWQIRLWKSLYLGIKHNLSIFCGRSRVDQEDPAGALHPLRLTDDLEPDGRRNPQIAPATYGACSLWCCVQLVRRDCKYFCYYVYCVHVFLFFFLLSIGFLKRANKRLWLHSLTIISSQSLVYKVRLFPPATRF